jgi:anti-sigma factor RsiW
MTEITCRQLVELLIDFITGELPPEHQQRIEKHLRECPPCVTYVETYRLTIQLTRRLPCQPPPPGLAVKLRKALEEIRAEQPPDWGPCGS